MINWKTETRKLCDLKPHPKNPRQLSEHDAKNLQISLKKFGLIDKPVITQSGDVIGGHQRIAILKKMGVKEIECYVPDTELSKRDVDELNIRLNRNLGEWDYDILANDWDANDLMEWGFTPEELSLDGGSLNPIDAIELNEKFAIEIECDSEEDQKEKYEKVKSLGYKCRLLSL